MTFELPHQPVLPAAARAWLLAPTVPLRDATGLAKQLTLLDRHMWDLVELLESEAWERISV